jgi:hypothetical protein
MKYVIFLFLLLSCSTVQEQKVDESIDSILIKSQQNLQLSDSVQTKSDSITKEYVVKVVKDFQILNNEVERFKTERVQLMSLQNVVTEKVIYKVDTVYIEVEKNFWGRKKTTTSVKSDSTSIITSDSTLETLEKIDTTSSNLIR